MNLYFFFQYIVLSRVGKHGLGYVADSLMALKCKTGQKSIREQDNMRHKETES